MANCFACGSDFEPNIKKRLLKYKEEFEQYGIKRVYYREKTNGDIMVMRADAFFRTTHKKLLTKKAIENGAEFALIQEFGKTADTKVLGNNQNG